MGNIEDYQNGHILKSIGRALQTISNSAQGLDDTPESIRVKQKICEFEPTVLSFEKAIIAVRSARTIAIGERICRPLHQGSEFTESIFLDELAEAMTEAGHARSAGPAEAEQTLKTHSGKHPLVMSKVSGKYLEICASAPESCVFWQAEKNGVRCMKRQQD
ncbi:MAG: hypothetical protein HGA60_03890 [Chlorobiaceae bacterium]|nr:hypothetical protein [Chlorobiaceae bacterium]